MLAARWRREPVGQEEALEIARQLCRGVQAAHEAQVLHLDLKSANVMLTRPPASKLRVVVMDFGLARAFGAGGVSGTRGYVAPERYEGTEATPAADLYCKGIILRKMIGSGGRPVDLQWNAIVQRSLEPDPKKRTQ